MHDRLQHLQDAFGAHADPMGDPAFHARVALLMVNQTVHVDFFGSPFDQPFTALCTTLAHSDIAPLVASVVLRSPDVGINGTCPWDLAGLVDAGQAFPQLRTFIVAQNAPGDHNRRIIARGYTEDGILGRLLQKAPHLHTLIVPSAPDATFFAQVHPNLRCLHVDAGYDTHHFIGRLAAHACFPGLRSLAFGEYNETSMANFLQQCTPFTEYRQLFVAPHFATVRSFVWRNPVCSAAEIAELRAIRTADTLQFQIVTCSTRYL